MRVSKYGCNSYRPMGSMTAIHTSKSLYGDNPTEHPMVRWKSSHATFDPLVLHCIPVKCRLAHHVGHWWCMRRHWRFLLTYHITHGCQETDDLSHTRKSQMWPRSKSDLGPDGTWPESPAAENGIKHFYIMRLTSLGLTGCWHQITSFSMTWTAHTGSYSASPETGTTSWSQDFGSHHCTM